MLPKSEILNRIRSSKGQLSAFGISKIGLFGSSALSTTANPHDIDILIDFQNEKETFENFMLTVGLLEKIFEGEKLDIVTFNGLSPFIGPHILKEVEYV